jgi:hypothetical protein
MRTYASNLLLLFHSYYLLPFRLLLPVQRYRMIEEHNIEAVTVQQGLMSWNRLWRDSLNHMDDARKPNLLKY